MRRILFALPLVAAGAGVLVVGLHPGFGSGWSEQDLALVRSLSLEALPPLPADASNGVADDPRAAELGRAMFFDTRFSSTGDVSCATCHLPDRQFQDDRALAQGVGRTDRRTMPIAGMAYSPFLFWDGRKDSLWSQALGPLESAVEHGGDRTQYARLVAEHYSEDYKAIFGPLPDFDSLPAHAGPVAEPGAAAAWEDECAELRFMAPERHEMLRAFKTPSLRGVASRPPYMHAAQISKMADVVAHYVAAPEAPAGHSELRPLDLDEQERRQIEAFLRSLDQVRPQ